MPEFRHVRSGSLNIPNGSAGHAHGQMMPRSPPSAFPPGLCLPRCLVCLTWAGVGDGLTSLREASRSMQTPPRRHDAVGHNLRGPKRAHC